MKFVFLSLAIALSSLAQADGHVDILTRDLKCIGKAAGHPDIKFLVISNSFTTEIRFANGGNDKDFVKFETLKATSEGNAYIQQVSNELGYNLYLQGPGVSDVLDGKKGVKVKLEGSLDLFNTQANFALKCAGTLN